MAGLVIVSVVFEHADVRLLKLEASSELDAMGISSWVFRAEIKQSPHVTEGPRSGISRQFHHRYDVVYSTTRFRGHLLTRRINMELVPNLGIAICTGPG